MEVFPSLSCRLACTLLDTMFFLSRTMQDVGQNLTSVDFNDMIGLSDLRIPY